MSAPIQSLRASLVLLLLTGCASPWEQNFQANPELGDTRFPPTQQVEMRVVEFDRLQRYEEAERKIRKESTTAPEDYTPEQRTAAKNRLLEALQLRERGDEIEILGWSRFAETQHLDLRGRDLSDFAKKIGADVVVASSAFAGPINRIVDVPLTTYSNFTTFAGPRGRRVITGTGHTTTWVPTPVTEDQFYYEAVFLRRR
ncbi:MAG TPA: hypothetical protein VH518_16895 [Tepidisphaeraceae bacterium]|jgi:hypothetical protein